MSFPEPINVVFCCDDKFADKLQVAIFSLVSNTRSTVAVYIIDCEITVEHQAKIDVLKTNCKNLIEVKFKKPKRNKYFEEFPVAEYFSSSIFYRLAIHETFSELERAIYFDCDVIVDGDIQELWQVNLNGHSFGALDDETNFSRPEDVERRKKKVGIPINRNYMSSGVLLLDFKKFAADCVFERVLNFVSVHKGPLPCPEQDAMNICLSPDEHLPISPKFNFTPFANLAKQCLKKVKKPIVIHYSCGKPWVFNKKLVNLLYKIGLFRYELGFIKKYWEYSDQIDEDAFSSKDVRLTLRFLYKRLFGKVEYFMAKRIRNKIIKLISCRSNGKVLISKEN